MDEDTPREKIVQGCQDNPDNCPPGQDRIDPWLCHVCGDGYRNQRATACTLCFQIACQAHIDLIVVDNHTYHHPELKLVCSLCQQKLAVEQNESS